MLAAIQSPNSTSLPEAVFLVFLAFAHLSVLRYVVQRLWQRQPVIEYEPRRQFPRMLAVDVTMTLLLVLLLLGIGGAIAASIRPEILSPDPKSATGPTSLDVSTMIQGVALTFLIIGAVGAALATSAKLTADDFGFNLGQIRRDLRLGLVAYFGIMLPVLIIQVTTERVVEYKHPLIESYEKNPTLGMMALLALVAAIAAPLSEELLFRVLLQGWFESLESARKAKKSLAVSVDEQPPSNPDSAGRLVDLSPPNWLGWWPMLASSTIFALMHWGQGAAPIPLFFFALVLGYVYQRTHRIWPSLVVHMLLNGVTVATLWLGHSGS